ncbi:hypothetical protein WANA13_0313 [Wolbachia endosymbiont of Drosophila ananassae]|nr:hypothetical protein WANA13_0313 [Wolbachia endosymbiont of Drosophila ananassae]
MKSIDSGSPQKQKNLLDKLRQPTYHDSEAIVFAFANLQIKR